MVILNFIPESLELLGILFGYSFLGVWNLYPVWEVHKGEMVIALYGKQLYVILVDTALNENS